MDNGPAQLCTGPMQSLHTVLQAIASMLFLCTLMKRHCHRRGLVLFLVLWRFMEKTKLMTILRSLSWCLNIHSHLTSGDLNRSHDRVSQSLTMVLPETTRTLFHLGPCHKAHVIMDQRLSWDNHHQGFNTWDSPP